MPVNLKLLHTFAHVAQLSSFSRAAEELGRSPAAISMQIADLEAQIGLKLLERTTRSVVPTPDGAVLLRSVRESIESLEKGINDARDAAERRRGRVIFGCAPTVASSALAAVLSQFRTVYPTISLQVHELTSNELLPAIRNREIDFGITPFVQAISDLSFDRLLREPLVALASSEHFESLEGTVSLAQLSHLPLLVMQGMPSIILRNGQELPTQVAEYLQNSDHHLEVVCKVRQATTLVDLAMSGMGIGIVPKLAVPLSVPSHLNVIRLTEPEIVRDIGVATLKNETLGKPALVLTKIFRDHLGSDDGLDSPF